MKFTKNSQDWGGRHKENPPNSKRITCKQVYALAGDLGIEIRHGTLGRSGHFYHSDVGWQTWEYYDAGAWRILGNTNLRAFEALTTIAKSEHSAAPR